MAHRLQKSACTCWHACATPRCIPGHAGLLGQRKLGQGAGAGNRCRRSASALESERLADGAGGAAALLPQPGVHALLMEMMQARQRAHDRAVAKVIQAHAACAQAAVFRRPPLALRRAHARPPQGARLHAQPGKYELSVAACGAAAVGPAAAALLPVSTAQICSKSCSWLGSVLCSACRIYARRDFSTASAGEAFGGLGAANSSSHETSTYCHEPAACWEHRSPRRAPLCVANHQVNTSGTIDAGMPSRAQATLRKQAEHCWRGTCSWCTCVGSAAICASLTGCRVLTPSSSRSSAS